MKKNYDKHARAFQKKSTLFKVSAGPQFRLAFYYLLFSSSRSTEALTVWGVTGCGVGFISHRQTNVFKRLGCLLSAALNTCHQPVVVFSVRPHSMRGRKMFLCRQVSADTPYWLRCSNSSLEFCNVGHFFLVITKKSSSSACLCINLGSTSSKSPLRNSKGAEMAA